MPFKTLFIKTECYSIDVDRDLNNDNYWFLYSSDISFSTCMYRISKYYVTQRLKPTKPVYQFYFDGFIVL